MSFEASALLLAWMVIAVLALAMAGILRQVARLTANQQFAKLAEEVVPKWGSAAPRLDGIDFSRPTLVLFSDATCVTCEAVLSEAREILSERGRGMQFVVAFMGEANTRVPGAVTIEHQERAFRDYGLSLTPSAVAVDVTGQIAQAAPIGSVAAFREFVTAAGERVGATLVEVAG